MAGAKQAPGDVAAVEASLAKLLQPALRAEATQGAMEMGAQPALEQLSLPAEALTADATAAAQEADGFPDLPAAAARFRAFLQRHRWKLGQAWGDRLAGAPELGVVIAAGFPASLANAFVSLWVLRHHLNCSLPATVMYWGRSEFDRPSPVTTAIMKAHIDGLTFMDVSDVAWPRWHRSLDGRNGSLFQGWKIKAAALYHAPYRHVLYLDSDSMPLLDPSALFASAAYGRHGALFWPDIWCGSPDLYRVLGMPEIGRQRQTESGQLALDRGRHWLALEWALFLNANDALTYKLTYGDKDTFRAAFFLAAASRDFYQGGFRARGLLQAAPSGQAAFLHRVGRCKYDPGSDEGRPISHVTVPSCPYFMANGWNSGVIPQSHFQQSVFTADPRAAQRPGSRAAWAADGGGGARRRHRTGGGGAAAGADAQGAAGAGTQATAATTAASAQSTVAAADAQPEAATAGAQPAAAAAGALPAATAAAGAHSTAAAAGVQPAAGAAGAQATAASGAQLAAATGTQPAAAAGTQRAAAAAAAAAGVTPTAAGNAAAGAAGAAQARLRLLREVETRSAQAAGSGDAAITTAAVAAANARAGKATQLGAGPAAAAVPDTAFAGARQPHPDFRAASSQGPLAQGGADGAMLARRPPTHCSFSFTNLYAAVQLCGRYNYEHAPGSERLPVFEVAPGSYVGRAIAAAEEAFRILRGAKKGDPSLF
eukprot:scaffold5.g982.t1